MHKVTWHIYSMSGWKKRLRYFKHDKWEWNKGIKTLEQWSWNIPHHTSRTEWTARAVSQNYSLALYCVSVWKCSPQSRRHLCKYVVDKHTLRLWICTKWLGLDVQTRNKTSRHYNERLVLFESSLLSLSSSLQTCFKRVGWQWWRVLQRRLVGWGRAAGPGWASGSGRGEGNHATCWRVKPLFACLLLSNCW